MSSTSYVHKSSHVAHADPLIIAPELYARHYNRNFYRATWILTALDAGFWSAMSIRPAFLRHILSIVFSIGYLFNAEAAEEKVHKLRAVCTVEMMRVSWEKSTSPILWFLSGLMRPKLCRPVIASLHANSEQCMLSQSISLNISLALSLFLNSSLHCRASSATLVDAHVRAPFSPVESHNTSQNILCRNCH